MNLQQLEYIIAVDKYKNFSQAAESCFVTQATLSTMVKRLEQELDLVLFDRKTSPLITTDEGREIIELAKKTIQYSSAIKDAANNINDKIQGKVRIGVIPTIANSLLKFIVSPLSEKYKELEIEFIEITTENILSKLKLNEIDMGIISTPFPYKDNFEEEILYYEKLFVFGKNKSDDKKYLLPSELQNEKIWLLEEGNCLRDQIISLCEIKEKKQSDKLKFESSSFETILSLVESFGGLTLLPELYLKNLSSERLGNISEFQAPFPVREVSIIHYRPYAKARIIKVIAEEIKNAVKPNLSTSKLKNSEQSIVMI